MSRAAAHPPPRAGSCLLLALAVSCWAAADARAQWSVDASVEHFSLREHVSPIDVHETGPRVALGLGFVQPRAHGLLLAYRGSAYGGNPDYEGSLQFDPTVSAHGASLYIGTTQGAELRYRWPDAIDALVGLDLDVWRRRLSVTQREDYRNLSARVGIERLATSSSPMVAGASVRWMLATSEHATISEGGVTYRLILSPGVGASPMLHVGYRVAQRVTVLAYWDGKRLARSQPLALLKRGRPQAIVFQPATAVNVVSVRVALGL